MMIAVTIVVPVMIVVMIVVMVMVVSMIPMIVAWGIFRRSNEIDGPIAGMVFVAVPTPVLGMSRRHV